AGADVASGVADELQNLRMHATTAADLKAALEAFVTRFPADPRSAEFKNALLLIPAAGALESWQQLLTPQQGGGGQLNPVSLADATTRWATSSASNANS